MTSERPIRFGLIGCGGIANGFHLPDLSRIEGVRLMACADVRREAAEQTAARWQDALGHAWTTDSPEALLAREDVDAVVVATHHETHAHFAALALEAGKHVLVQKPLTTRMEDADRLVEVADARPQQKVQCLPYNWTNALVEARRLIDTGTIGRVAQARRRIAHPGPGRDSWFYNPEIAKFGALFDMGVYAVSGITALLGPAVSVSALVGTFEEGVRIDDNATLQMRFESGAFGTAETAWTQVAGVEGTVVYGLEGTIALDLPGPDRLRLFERTDGVSFASRGRWTVPPLEPDPTAAPHRHFVECIREDRTPRGTPRHARHVVEIMLAAAESHHTGRRMDLHARFAAGWGAAEG